MSVWYLTERKGLIMKVNTRVRALIMEKNGIHMLRRKDAKTGTSALLLPGGGVDEGETLAAALVREVKEEIGVSLNLVRKARNSYIWQAYRKPLFGFINTVGKESDPGSEYTSLKYTLFDYRERELSPVNMEPEKADLVFVPYRDLLRTLISENLGDGVLDAIGHFSGPDTYQLSI